MAAGEAAGLIAQLTGRGWSYAQIGRFLGRDVSLVSQVARGLKPGSNLVPALAGAARSGKGPEGLVALGAANVPRRAQRVRQKAERVGAAPAPEKQALHVTSGGNVTIKKTLEQASREGKRVQLTGTFHNVKRTHRSGGKRGRPPVGQGKQEKEAEVPMFQKGGWDAKTLLDRIEHPQAGDKWKPGDARGAIRALAQKQGIIEHAGSLRRVEIHGYNPV